MQVAGNTLRARQLAPEARVGGAQGRCAARANGRGGAVSVEAFKKARKQQQVVLTADVKNVGPKGTLTKVSNGYFRNYLLPQGMASLATADVLAQFKAAEEAKEAAAAAELAEAKTLATGLATLGKFTVKKTVGEEGRIFGSVSGQDVAEAIEAQTSRSLDKSVFSVPDISEVGTYDVVAQLHPEVKVTFKLIVAKQ